jgi:hemerythrin-like domain-containing protein
MENTNNPIQLMLDEHEVISSAEGVIQNLAHRWEKSEEDFINHVRSLLSFFREYSDKFHHYKEEQVLFPELENLGDFVVNSLVSELKEHHEMFRGYTQSIKGLLDDHQFEQAYTILSTYMNELLDHIAAENDELFVMAESLLSASDLETMYFRFKDIDLELGESNKAELCEMLTEIKLSIDGLVD